MTGLGLGLGLGLWRPQSGGAANPAKLPVNLVAHGNSLTYGTGASDRLVYSWPAQIVDLIADYAVFNEGIAGETTPNLTAAISTAVIPHLADPSVATNVLVIYEGGNDMQVGGSTPAEAWANIVAYISAARSAGWVGYIGTCTIGPRSNLAQASIDSFNALVRANWASAGFDFLSDFGDDPALATPIADGVHYNDAQYTVVARYFADSINALAGVADFSWPDLFFDLSADSAADDGSGRAESVADASAAGLDAAQPNPDLRPSIEAAWRNGRALLRGDSANLHRLDTAAFADGPHTGPLSVYLVGEWSTQGASGFDVFFGSQAGGAGRIDVYREGSAIRAYSGSGNIAITQTIPDGTPFVARLICNGSSSSVLIEADGLAPITGSGTLSISWSALRILANFFPYSTDGGIARILGLLRVASPTLDGQIRSELKTQYDITPNDVVLSGLLVSLDADNAVDNGSGYAVSIPDTSGQGNDATQAVEAQYPAIEAAWRNGHALVRGNAATLARLDTGTFSGGAVTSATIYVVGEWANSGGTYDIIYGTTTGGANRHDLYRQDGTTRCWSTAGGLSPGPSFPDGTPFMAKVTLNGDSTGSVRIWADGYTELSASGTLGTSLQSIRLLDNFANIGGSAGVSLLEVYGGVVGEVEDQAYRDQLLTEYSITPV